MTEDFHIGDIVILRSVRTWGPGRILGFDYDDGPNNPRANVLWLEQDGYESNPLLRDLVLVRRGDRTLASAVKWLESRDRARGARGGPRKVFEGNQPRPPEPTDDLKTVIADLEGCRSLLADYLMPSGRRMTREETRSMYDNLGNTLKRVRKAVR